MENRQSYNNRKCAVCGIRQLPKSTTFLSSFPLDPVRCRLWVKATGDEDLVHLPIEKLHELKYLCGKHFSPECFNDKGNRLLKTAVPTENLTRPLLSEHCFREFPLHVKSFYDMQKNKLKQCVPIVKKVVKRSNDPLYEDCQIDHHELSEGDDIQEITEVIKIEAPDDADLPPNEYDPPMAQSQDLDTILGSDDGAVQGFSPFVRPNNAYRLPVINMFAVMEFISMNNHYSTLDYRKLKDVVTRKGHDRLLSGLQVQNLEGVHRIRCTVHLLTSAHCAVEYDVTTHTVTRSECLCCPVARCPHVAALLMWLHTASNRQLYELRHVADDEGISTGTAKRPQMKTGSGIKVEIEVPSQPEVGPAASAGLGHPETGALGSGNPADRALGSGDPADEDEAELVDDDAPGPSTAKRKKMPLPKVKPRYTATISKTKSVPKDTDEDIDDSIIKCSFTRKCLFDVWRSTSGPFTERVLHTRTIMTEAFRDPDYVIDFQPLERRLDALCTEIEGYWNAEVNKSGFESKYLDYLAITEYIEMNKHNRGGGPGSSRGLKGGAKTKKSKNKK